MQAPQKDASRCSKCRRYCRLVTTFLFSHIGLCALVVGYSIIGAFTFEALEAGYEQHKRKMMIKQREDIVTELWQMTVGSSLLYRPNWTKSATDTLQEFEITLVRAVRKEGYDGKDESPLQWTFSGALLYSIIVITTIGYGNIAPKTPWGKVVTIFYAIVGIPLLLLCLSNIGDAMAHSFKFIYWKVCCYLCVRPKKRRKRQTPSKPIPAPYRTTTTTTTIPPAAYRRPPPPPLQDSPHLASTSTYHTAPTSPTISSSASTPAKASLPRDEPPSRGHPIAVISNKYALQDDVPYYPGAAFETTTRFTTSPLFKIVNNRAVGDFGYSNHDDYGVHGRFQWKREPPYPDPEDEESARDVSPELDEEEVTVPMWLCLALVGSYICGGAVLFTFWEKWNFLDSSYFCFVTLTTIGFGDLVPGSAVISDDNQLTLGLCSLYLLFGMALLAMSFNLVQEEVTRTVKCVGRRIGIVSDDEDD